MTANSGVAVWSKTAATNNTADSAVNWQEGQSPSSVNDSARGMMAATAKWRADNSGSLATTGTSTAYVLATNQNFAAKDSSFVADYTVAFQIDEDCGSPVTLDVDSLGAKPLRAYPGVELVAGALKSGGIYHATYKTSNSGEWLLHDQAGAFGAKTFTGAITALSDISASGVISSSSTSYTKPASGTTAQRPGAPAAGAFRYNSDTVGMEAYNGSSWTSLSPTVPSPQGYLTLLSVSSSPTTAIPGSDQSAKSTVYYRPYGGNLLPVSDGTNVNVREFTEMSLGLVSSHTASGIYDVFSFDDSGTLRIGTGPVWGTVTAGSGDRGTGSGTTELDLLKGILVNKVAATMRNGSSTYSVAAKAGTYLGTILIDGSAGQVSCHVAYGQSRKWGVWNAYNKRLILPKAGNASGYGVAGGTTIRPAANNSANSITMVVGLPETIIKASYKTGGGRTPVGAGGSLLMANSIGFNSTSTASGFSGVYSLSNQGGGNINTGGTIVAEYTPPVFIGAAVFTALESNAGNNQWDIPAGEAGNLLTVEFTA